MYLTLVEGTDGDEKKFRCDMRREMGWKEDRKEDLPGKGREKKKREIKGQKGEQGQEWKESEGMGQG